MKQIIGPTIAAATASTVTAAGEAPEPRVHLHGSCVARRDAALLLVGAPGTGKSDLALRLLDRGFDLVADDRVIVEGGFARPSEALAGLLEARGIGLLALPHRAPARVVLVLELGPGAARLPEPVAPHPLLGVPCLPFDPRSPAAPLRAEVALDCVLDPQRLRCGFLRA